ncbi:hypothetical protein CDAR_392241 [Caerostris darwini]|uniref:Uncharacterized protein n=1 Tax=Caerostris darwini TaxID=1538125 RepID=A0AAV4SQ83_9ARAC|nr:hypothetical protein CDAR_392241 [Caerostris darwini]
MDKKKTGYHIIQVSNDQISYKSVSSKIIITFKAKQLLQLKERTRNKCREGNIYNLPDYLRSSAVATFRLAVMHDYLYAHPHRYKIVDRPASPFCSNGAAMNAEHLVCSALSQISVFSRYWEARNLLNCLKNLILF